MKIIIPARLGSKGLPFKNRTLFKYTADIIPDDLKSSVIVTTDDPEIIKMAQSYGFDSINRPSSLAQDTTSTKEVILHTIKEKNIASSETLVMLYLTYPERTWDHVLTALYFFNIHNEAGVSESMLCKKEVKTHPYLCLEQNGAFGKQLVTHDLYRRQDYPTCFEISHYVAIFTAGSINKLNSNLYCDSTVFFAILPDTLDVDTKNDLDLFYGK